MLSEIWDFEDSQDVGKDENGVREKNQGGPFRICFNLTFHCESYSGAETIGSAQLLGVSISINTIIENRSYKEEYSKPHEGKKEFTQKVNNLNLSFSDKGNISIKIWNWGDKENKDFNTELSIEELLFIEER